MLRIIAGQWRRRQLVVPAGAATRPSADRLRETLFAMLTSRLGGFQGCAVGDFFAGSGALGFEALSRGAARCLFVERDRAALDAIRTNARQLGLAGGVTDIRAEIRVDIRAGDVLALGPAPAPLDLLLMDPPYGTGAGSVALDKLNRLGWVGPASWISVETGHDETVAVAGFTIIAERRVGKGKLSLLRQA